MATDTAGADPGPSLEDRRALASAARYVAEIRPIISEPRAVAYLRDVRKIDVAAIEDVLSRTDAIGWHPSVYFNEPEYPERGDPPHPLHGQKLGAIIGIMTDPVTAEPTGAISRTFIHEGRKIGPAKTLGVPTGLVRLSKDDEVLEGLNLAEGIETSLDAMARGLRPIWSAGSKGLIAKFLVLSGIEFLTILADNDANGAGEKAARECETRWLEAGREVRIIIRDCLGDLNDATRAS